MPIIKPNQAVRPSQRVSGYDLGDFVIEGQQIVAAARAKAEQMVAEARAEAERIRGESHRRALDEGYQDGLAQGREAGHREAFEVAKAEFEAKQVQLAAACESLFREVDRRKREMLLSAHRDLIILAINIAERVTKRIGLIDPQAARENLQGVIDLVGGSSDMIVEVNPVDAETLETFAGELVAKRGRLKHVVVTADDRIEPGGCVVKTRGGRIDATLATQLDRIAQELVPGIDRRQASGQAEHMDVRGADHRTPDSDRRLERP